MNYVIIGFEFAIGVALAALAISLALGLAIIVKERPQMVLAGVLVIIFSGAALMFLGMLVGVVPPSL